VNIQNIYYRFPYNIQKIIFNIYGYHQKKKRFSSDYNKYYEELKKNEKLQKEQIDEYQFKELKKLLEYSFQNVPYYQKLFNNIGFLPGDLKEIDDIKKLPVLTKTDIKENFEDLKSRTVKKRDLVLHSTGGTTGEKFIFYLPTNLRWNFNYATLYRFYSWAGIKLGDPRASIAGQIITNKSPFYMYNHPEKQLYYSAHFMNESNNYNFLKELLKRKPVFIQGHPSALEYIAKTIIEKGYSYKTKAVFTTSEQLFSEQRDTIQKAFDCFVYDTYGMGEMVASASECHMHNGFHLAPEYGFTEVINMQKYNNKIGEIVSTSLKNYAMPFIRYKCGDLGLISKNYKCPCGSNFPFLQKIVGRIDDIVYSTNGEKILPLTIRIRLKEAGSPDFQLLNEENNVFILNLLISEDNKDQINSKRIEEVLKHILGEKIRLKIAYNLPLVKSKHGKQQLVVKLFNNKNIQK
jgi:phenylacetate-CoA ligase